MTLTRNVHMLFQLRRRYWSHYICTFRAAVFMASARSEAHPQNGVQSMPAINQPTALHAYAAQ